MRSLLLEIEEEKKSRNFIAENKRFKIKYNSLKTKISKLDKNYFNSLEVKAVSVKEIQKNYLIPILSLTIL